MRPLVLTLSLLVASASSAGEVAKADLGIVGLGLEVDRNPVVTAADIPAFVQTKFGGKQGDESPVVAGLSALGELTGPGIGTPITLVTTPGRPFALPALHEKGDYALQNIRLVGANGEFLQQSVPAFAVINVTDVLKTEIRVRQLTPEELRERGIVVDSRNFDVYEYTLVFGLDQESVTIPYPVIVDRRTHEVKPVPRESPYKIPKPPENRAPPRFEPPQVETFQLSFGGAVGGAPPPPERNGVRPSIPAALVVPTGFGVLHQHFAVILQVQNASPDEAIRLDTITASIHAPSAMRVAKVMPAVAIGQPVPIVDQQSGATFLVAAARGEAEWTLEALRAGTHTVDVEVNATFQKPGQEDMPLRGRVSTSLVVSDPRFQINFSHPDTVRKDERYTAYAFITNLSAQRQHVILDLGHIPACSSGAAVENICRQEGESQVALDLEPGELKPVPYKLNAKITGKVFAAAGVATDDAIGVSVRLTMGVSASGVPLSPATLVMPHYARYLPPDFVDANMQLLGLGYGLATAPLNQFTARAPRVIKSDIFHRAQQIARAGQRIYIADDSRDAFFHLALDLLGNIERVDQLAIAPELREWDELRRLEESGRRAGAAMARELENATAGLTPKQFVDVFAAAASHRTPFLFAYAHGPPVAGAARPYALSVKTLTSGVALEGVAEAESGWVRTLPYSELTKLGETGELALVGRWREEDFRVSVIPASPSFRLHLIYPDEGGGRLLRSDIEVTNATPGVAFEVDLRRAARTLIVKNGTAAPLVDAIPQTPLRVLGAAQDLYLDEEGHLVSLLFNRPIDGGDAAALRDRFSLTTNVAKASYSVTRRNTREQLQIPGAALQEDAKILHVTFDKSLSRNAAYVIGIDALADRLSKASFSASDVVPRIENNRPGGILTGKVLRADNTPIGATLVTMTGQRGGQQLDVTLPDGRFLYEYVARDLDAGILGNYVLSASADGKTTALEGAVRLPGEVHTVNLVFLGRGRVQGQVRYSDGEVLANAEVTIGSTLFNQFRRGWTNGQGRYEVGDLPVGPLTFSVVDGDGRPTFAANQIRTAGEVITQDLVIERREFPGSGNVRVVVRRSDTNALVAGAHVGVWMQSYALRDGYTDSSGSFTFAGVPAGLVSIIAADFGISRTSAGVEVELRADQTLEQTLVLSVPSGAIEYATLEGAVTRDDPAAPGDATKDVRVANAIVSIAGMPAITASADGSYVYPDLPLSARERAIIVFDPATGRRGHFSVPTLVAGANHMNLRLRSTEPHGMATMRVRLYGARGESVSGYRVISPGYPPDVFAALGGGVYDLKDVRVPQQAEVVAVPKDKTGAYGEQAVRGSVRVDFNGQVGITDLRLPGAGTVVVRLEMLQPCSTPPCYTQAIGPVSLGYSVWDEAEQGFIGRTIEGQPDSSSGLVTFANIPARQELTLNTVRHPAGHASAKALLAYDGDVRQVTLRLQTIGDVSGRVLAHDGVTPLSGATVRLFASHATYAPAITNPDGTFRFAGVAANSEFTLVADFTQNGIYRTGHVGGRTPAGGGPVSNLTITMREQATVEGAVVDARKIAVPLARYWLQELAWPYRTFGRATDPLFADIGGRFVISNVFTGPFRITAVDPENQEIRGHYSGALTSEGDAAHRNVHLRIGSEGVGAVSVTVVDPLLGFAPVANAEVALIRGDQRFDFSSTNDNGVVFFEQLPPGRYLVTAYSKALGRAGVSAQFDVAASQTVTTTVHLEFRGTVSGFLTDPESEPSPNARVRGMPVTLSSGPVRTADSTDGDGAFEFIGVPEGNFTLAAFEIGTHRVAQGPAGLFISRVVPERTNIHLELERTGSLTVNVYLPNDSGGAGTLAPLAEVTVWQGNLQYGPVPYYRGQQGNPVTFRKLLRGLPYGIEVRELGSENRVVKTGGGFAAGVFEQTQNVVLPTSGSVEVRVVNASNQPVEDARVEISARGLNTRTMYTPSTGIVTLPGVPFGWVTAQAAKDNVAASAGGELVSRSQTLQLILNLGSSASVAGLVDAEAGIGQPSAGTRVLMTVTTNLRPQPLRLETITDANGAYRFTGIPVGGTSLAFLYYGPDDTTIGAAKNVSVADGTTGTIAIARVKLDATPPRVLLIDPPANATNVAPTTSITITFSEPIASAYLTPSWFTLVATDNSQLVSCAITASQRPDGTYVVRMTPPPAPAGQPFPLRSNVIYRLALPSGIQDTTGNPMTVSVGSSFTTVNYTEPAIVHVDPPQNLPIPQATTFRLRFNKPIDIASFEPGYGGSVLLQRLDAYKGSAVETIPISRFLDMNDPSTLIVAPAGVAIAESSFYRLTVAGARDTQTPPNVQKEARVLEFFSFDTKKPVAKIVSPVGANESLVSGVLYAASVAVTDEGTSSEASDVAFVDWMDANGALLARVKTKPFAYSFVAPATNAPATYALKASATDLSGNSSATTDTFTWNVVPNDPPREIVVTNAPTSIYPGGAMQTRVSFKDEGVAVTVALELRGTHMDGGALRQVIGSQHVKRASASVAFADALFHYSVPLTLKDGSATIVATATDAVNKSGSGEAALTILKDETPPRIVSFAPAAETRFTFNQSYAINVQASDAETGVARATIRVSDVEVFSGAPPFAKTLVVPPRNADTRVPIAVTVYDHRGNAVTETRDVIYERVDDASLPRAVWLTPLDGAALPSNIAGWQPMLRVRANDDVKVTRVRFESPALAAPIELTAPASGDIFETRAALNWPADKQPFVIKAIVSDGDPAHDVELPITVDPVEAAPPITADITIFSGTADQYANKSIVVRGALLQSLVPLTLKDLILIDGARLSNPEEVRLDVTISDRLFVDGDSRVDVTGRGYLGGLRTKSDGSFTNPSRNGRTASGTGASANGAFMADASHGGSGGSYLGATNATYGSITEPLDFGAGGGASLANHPGSNGGGAVALRGGSGFARFVVAGSIRADGGSGGYTSGAGGSVLLESRALITSPVTRITANGMDEGGSHTHDLGGGGGRIAIRASERFDHDPSVTLLQARGGRNGFYSLPGEGAHYVDGGAGTIFLRRPGANRGELIVSSFDERFPSSTHRTAATPLAGALDFDAITIGPRALARFDVAPPANVIADATASVITPADLPSISILSTTPNEGSSVAQNTSIAPRFSAQSTAGIREVRTILSVQPADVVSYPGWPQTLTGATSSIAVPSGAPLGATTLIVRVTDRAGRVAESAPMTFHVVSNAAPLIATFNVTPLELYAGRSIDVSASASDDVEVKSLTLAASSPATVISQTPNKPTPTTMARAFTVNVPVTAPSNSDVTLTLSASDDFPGRTATAQTKTVRVLADAIAPSVAIVTPLPDARLAEAAGATFVVEATASDTEVAVKRVTVTFEGVEHDMTFVSGNLYRRTLNVPGVEGSEPVAKQLVVRARDYDDNVAQRELTVYVQPLLDAEAPALAWVCTSPRAMVPAGFEVALRVSAVPSRAQNGVKSVELIVDGGTPIAATSAGTNLYEAKYAISALAAAGSVHNVRVRARSVSDNESELLGNITVVSGFDISTTSTIEANDLAFENQSFVIRSGGKLIVSGAHRFRNVAVLPGGTLTQLHADRARADLLTLEQLYVACNASINADGLGFARNATFPGAAVPDYSSAGSHIGRGAPYLTLAGGAFDSVYRPLAGGGGGDNSSSFAAGDVSNGGGALRIHAASHVTVDGSVSANGREWVGGWGGGAGGAVWITTPGHLGGSGRIDANGAAGSADAGGGGGAIALEYGATSGALLNRVAARGGSIATSRNGAPGSVYRKSASATFGDLTIDNPSAPPASTQTELGAFGVATVSAHDNGSITLAGRRWLSPALAGHWLRVFAPDGTLRGTWRIATVTNDASIAAGRFQASTQDTLDYDGYLVYSAAGIAGRTFVAARYASGRWEYDNDTSFVTFTPQAGDAIIASFTKSAAAITSVSRFRCPCPVIEGMRTAELAGGEILPNARISGVGGYETFPVRDDAEFYLQADARGRALIVSRADAKITLESGASVQAGDTLKGVYRFDSVRLGAGVKVVTEDEVEGVRIVDPASSLIAANPAAPLLDVSKVTIVRGLYGPTLIGSAGAVADADAPLDVVARNAGRTAPLIEPSLQNRWSVLTGDRGGLSIERVRNLRSDGAGASSTSIITSSGFVSFGASQTNKEIVAGLAPGDTTRNNAEPGTNAFRLLANATYELWANGAAVAGKSGAYTTSTVFRIEKTPAAIRWLIDSVPLHEVTANVPASLRFDVAFQNADSGELHSIDYVTATADNGRYHAVAAPNGSFRLPILGLAGESIDLIARDRHLFPLESRAIAVATIPNDTGVASVTLAPNELTGGRSMSGTATLAAPAGSEGAFVRLTSSHAAARVPTNIIIPAGQSSGTFTIITTPVNDVVNVAIGATYGGAGTSAALRVVKDTTPPAVTINAPAANAVFIEGSSNAIAVQATIDDPDSGTLRAFATWEGSHYELTRSGGVWTGSVPSPFVDGAVDVVKTLTVTGVDNNANAGTASVDIRIRPVVDAAPPTIAFVCSSANAMYPIGYAAGLRVRALAPNAANPLHKVEYTITDPNGAATSFTPASLGGDLYEVVFTVPSAADRAVFTVTAVATTASGTSATAISTFTVVAGAREIRSNVTIAANDTSYDNQAVIVFGGFTATIAGAHTFERLAILPNGKITHAENDRLDVNAAAAYIACGGTIDVTARGYASHTTLPGALAASDRQGGSHLGRGGQVAAANATYGSVERPQELGGGGTGTSFRGGGVVRVTAQTLIVDGAILAGGNSIAGGANAETRGSAAGGSVWLRASRIGGAGTVAADGGNGCSASGGGGAIAVEYSDAASGIPALRARGGVSGHGACGTTVPGGPGTLFVKGPSSTFGNLTIDTAGAGSEATELPALGSGIAQSGSANATLVTDRATNVPAFFDKHWVRVTGANGVVKGTWRIAAIAAATLTLAPNAAETIAIQPGDRWQGVYRFDNLTLRGATLISGDVVETADTIVASGTVTFSRLETANLRVSSGTTLTHPLGDTLSIRATNEVRVDGAIDVTGRGYQIGASYPNAAPATSPAAGSHLGRGGRVNDGSATFGSVSRPREYGGGGTSGAFRGGGVVRIEAASVIVGGTIRADGDVAGINSGSRGGAAGGSVWITTGRIEGAGSIRADGGNGCTAGGGGGAIAIEQNDAASVLPAVFVRGGVNGHGACSSTIAGAPGTLYVKRAPSALGDLTIDSASRGSGITELPALGSGAAMGGSGGPTLVTDRASDIPPYFAGHWIEVTGAGGAVKGTWRIASVSGKSATLAPNGSETIDVVAGDVWRGLYRFDTIKLRGATLRTSDAVLHTTLDKDASSSFLANDGPPVFTPALRAQIVVDSTGGDAVVGPAGAVTDIHTPITLVATNTRTGAAFTGTAAANASFRIGVSGGHGDTFTLRATDTHAVPMTSRAIAVNGAIVDENAIVSLALDASNVSGGTGVLATLRFAHAARLNTVVALSSSDPSVAAVPATVTVPPGVSSLQFTVSTASPAAAHNVTITATLRATKSATFVVVPSSGALASLALTPSLVEGGTSVDGSVTLTSPAPAGGASVALASSDSALARVPASVTVAEGNTAAIFTVTTARVAASARATIGATFGTTRAATLDLTACSTLGTAAAIASSVSTIWFNDAAPANATVSGTPAFDATQAASGTQSLHFTAASGARAWSFSGATPLTVNASDELVLHALVNPCNPPREIAVTWSGSATLRASWGESLIDVASNPLRTGAIPDGGVWTRLAIPARRLGVTTSTSLSGLSINLHGGEAWFDLAGAHACTLATAARLIDDANEVVWFDDELPAGATATAWNWSSAQVARGTRSHVEPAQPGAHQHGFTGAAAGLRLAPGDLIYTYVLLDPCDPPRQLMLELHDGAAWRRVYWGEELVSWAPAGTSARMGAMPDAGQWVRLDVPASLLGLDDKTITNMTFTLYDGGAWFDAVGRVARVNVALNKLAEQSSTYVHPTGAFVASGAVDGDYKSEAAQDMAHTGHEAQPWWQVDLGASQPIEDLQIWFENYAASRRTDYNVYVSEAPFAPGVTQSTLRADPNVAWFAHPGAASVPVTHRIQRSGRYVRVQLNGTDYMPIAELQAWAPATPQPVNAAGGQRAIQSRLSDAWGQAYFGVNGDAQSFYRANFSITHTANDAQAWWEVDLGRIQRIARIDVYNRPDDSHDRLTNFYVLVADAPFSATLDTALADASVGRFWFGPASRFYSAAVDRTGRYVRVQLSGANSLSLSEVKVWTLGTPLRALSKPAVNE